MSSEFNLSLEDLNEEKLMRQPEELKHNIQCKNSDGWLNGSGNLTVHLITQKLHIHTVDV